MSEQETRYTEQDAFLDASGLKEASVGGDISISALHQLPFTSKPELGLFRNDFYEVTLAQNFEYLTFAIDGKQYTPKEESFICFTAPDQLQSFVFTDRPLKARGYVVHLPKKVLQQLEGQMGVVPFFLRENQSYYPISKEHFEALFYWAECMHQAKSDQKAHSNALMISFLTVLLVKTKELISVEKNELFAWPEAIAERFLDHVSSNAIHNSVKHYADQLALTPRQLNKVLRKVLNKTASQVIQEATIARAQGLLLQSEKNISDVAYELGFNELSNFSRLFKSATGQSPRSFQLGK